MSSTGPLTIGIDARAAVEVAAGRGRLVRELLRALAARDDGHRYRCYARTAWEEPLDDRFRWRLIGSGDPWWHVQAARAADRECDVMLSSNSYLTPLFMRRPAVPIVYDLVAFDPAMRPNRRSAVIERLTLGLCVRRSAAIVAISAATRDALVDRFPMAGPKTEVALLGSSPALTAGAPDEQLPAPGFVLAVGTLEPRKNLPRLVDAYRRLDPSVHAAHPLVVVGALGWQTGDTLQAITSLGDRAIRLGQVSDEALAELYRRCAVFCYPSLGEGFGLPVLEAMAAGATVLTASNSSLPEVGGDAVAYAPATDVAAIAAALDGLLADPERRRDLGERALARAATFSWNRFAEGALAAIERAAQASRRPAATSA
jgi:glycosyltransferase involved in cell wall biosynthesis